MFIHLVFNVVILMPKRILRSDLLYLGKIRLVLNGEKKSM